MDINGYPEEQELDIIKNWDLTKENVLDLIKYIRARWRYADCGFFELKGKKVLKLRLSTGGWSGNESIIDALHKNIVFWIMYWQMSRRGGHYWFKIKL